MAEEHNGTNHTVFTLQEVRYRDILHIEELSIPGVRTTCIVGPSGSGKSTLLRLLNRLISPTSGTIEYRSQDITEFDPVELRRDVVMLAQSTVIVDGSIRDNLVLGCRYSYRPIPDDDRLSEVLQMVHLDKPLDGNPNRLSGGEKQRLALARVLLMDPPVYLLDEPSSSLDEETALAIFDTLTEWVRGRDSTLIMVTHSSHVAKKYGEVTIHITAGQLQEVEVRAL